MKNKIGIIYKLTILTIFISCNNGKNNNQNNLALIKKGMTTTQVTAIMGPPKDTAVFPLDSLRYSFVYEAPLEYSDNFYVFFSTKDSLVTDIGDGL